MQKFTALDPVALCRPTSESVQSRTPTSDSGYDEDFVRWLERQVTLLRARNFASLDLDNLIEELESMGKRDRRELASRLETLLVHLLKCEFQPEMKGGSWLSTLLEQRSRINDLLKDSPSLGSRVAPLIAERFANAVGRAALETGIPAANFPAACTYPVEQVLNVDFIP